MVTKEKGVIVKFITNGDKETKRNNGSGAFMAYDATTANTHEKRRLSVSYLHNVVECRRARLTLLYR